MLTLSKMPEPAKVRLTHPKSTLTKGINIIIKIIKKSCDIFGQCRKHLLLLRWDVLISRPLISISTGSGELGLNTVGIPRLIRGEFARVKARYLKPLIQPRRRYVVSSQAQRSRFASVKTNHGRYPTPSSCRN